MGERLINPILNVHDNYRKVNIINSYWFVPSDPLNNHFTPTGDELWSNPANWSSGHVPLSTETATIDGGNITLDVTTTVNKLNISAGRTLTADNSSRVLTVENEVTSLGSISFTGSNVVLVLKAVTNVVSSLTPGTASTIRYARAGNQDVLPVTHYNISISGTGNKNLTANTTISGTVTTTGASGTTNLACGIYDLTVQGIVSMFAVGITKTGAGNMLFVGNLTLVGSTFNLSGNPTVEFRGGISCNNGFTSGTGLFKFTTNNQNIAVTGTILGNILISGAITLTVTTTNVLQITSITGDNAASTFVNNGTLYLRTSATPMAIGVWTYKTATASILGYNFNGDFTLPYTDYSGLYVGGTGFKSLAGNTTLTNGLTGVGKLQTSTYNLTVSGNSRMDGGGIYKSSGSGATIFIGNIIFAGGTIDYTSDIEFRGGLLISGSIIDLNSSTAIFSTNNQTLTVQAGGSFRTGNILISGAITLTANSAPVLSGTINGNNALSKLDNRGILELRNAQAPMLTGLFETNAAANTVIYASAGGSNQDVRGGTYRTLTLKIQDSTAAASVKRLLGNVSVVNTYTLTAPATLDSNGFALTNP